MKRFKIINEFVVEPPEFIDTKLDSERKLGPFNEPYPATFICAKRKSGKTVVLTYLVDEIFLKDAKKRGIHLNVYIFVSTAYQDPKWIALIKYLKKKKNVSVKVYTSIYERTPKLKTVQNKKTGLMNVVQTGAMEKTNLVKELLEYLNAADYDYNDVEKVDNKVKKDKIIKTGPKKKDNEPNTENLVIFDDIGKELRDDAISQLIKIARHSHTSIIASSQWPNDVHPMFLRQCSSLILFKNNSEDKLKEIYSKCDLPMEYDDFINKYLTATDGDHNFLFIDKNTGELRQNLNCLLD